MSVAEALSAPIAWPYLHWPEAEVVRVAADIQRGRDPLRRLRQAGVRWLALGRLLAATRRGGRFQARRLSRGFAGIGTAVVCRAVRAARATRRDAVSRPVVRAVANDSFPQLTWILICFYDAAMFVCVCKAVSDRQKIGRASCRERELQYV